MNSHTELMRHLISTISYRMKHAVTDLTDEHHFADFQAGNGLRTPLELVVHMNHLLLRTGEAYGLSLQAQDTSLPPIWSHEVVRFFDLLSGIDRAVEDETHPRNTMSIYQIIQGPFADVLTHIGQIVMLRRLFACPVTNVSFIQAKLKHGDIQS